MEPTTTSYRTDRRRQRRLVLCLQLVFVLSVLLVVWTFRGDGDQGTAGVASAAPATAVDTTGPVGPAQDTTTIAAPVVSGAVDRSPGVDAVSASDLLPTDVDTATSSPIATDEPATVVLPEMAGLTGAEAARLLRLLGLVADCDARRCDDTVIATVPPAGSELRRGAVVLLQF